MNPFIPIPDLTTSGRAFVGSADVGEASDQQDLSLQPPMRHGPTKW